VSGGRVSLFDELKRRKVARVAVVYAATAFVVLQAAELLASGLGLPDWVFPAITVAVVVGFPVALVLAWAFELTPEGVRRTEAEPAGAPAAEHGIPLLGKRTVFTAGVLVVLGIGIGAGWFLRAGPSTASDGERSIAVLAFTNLSADPENAFFAEGISEEILNLLAAVEDLSVASRTSAFAYRDGDVPISAIASALGVRYVLEGSVRKVGDRVRVTAQLIDAATDRHLWSETFDRTLDDIFAIQDEIAGAIGEALQVELLGFDGRSVASAEIRPELYERFLQSRFLLRQRNQAALERAIELLEEVVEGEPGYAPGLAQLAEAYLLTSGRIVGGHEEMRRRLDYVLELVERALAIDPSLAGALAVRGNVAMTRGAYGEAFRDYQRAIELDPDDPRSLHWLALLYSDAGHLERAEEALAQSLRLDPENANAQGWWGDLLAARGEWDAALAAGQRVVDLGNPAGHVSVAMSLLAMDVAGNLDRAESELGLALAKGTPSHEVPLEIVAAAEGRGVAVQSIVDDARADRLWLYVAMKALLTLDHHEALLTLLEWEDFLYERPAPLAWSHEHASMRRDPRFVAYLERRGVTDLWREIGPPADCVDEGDTYRCGLSALGGRAP
jgi:TolB-like protein/Flp pilus assembly protein TadD